MKKMIGVYTQLSNSKPFVIPMCVRSIPILPLPLPDTPECGNMPDSSSLM